MERYLTYQDALVIDPARKAVTDPAVLEELARLGIAASRTAFKYDYSRSFPRSKMYQVEDPDSPYNGAHVVVINNLPMVNARGLKCKAGWIDNGDGSYRADANQFEAIVRGNGITITRINDQPDGSAEGETTAWKPLLKLEGVVVDPLAPFRIVDDWLNPNYTGNVLEADYGICKRRLRLIEGRVLERWCFDRNPRGEVRIEHNFSGPKLKLGMYAVDGDTEVVSADQFNAAINYPVTLNASGEFYPDADPESTTMDAYLHNSPQDNAWSAVRAVANATAYGDSWEYGYDNFMATTSYDNWKFITRTLMLFVTSSIGSGKQLQSASLSLYAETVHSIVGAAPATHVCSSNPASDTSVAASDYSTFGTADFGSLLHAAWSGGYNGIPLNANGLNAINPTGITRLGVRSNYDLFGTVPPWSANIQGGVRFYLTEYGAGTKPKLVVVYISTPTVTTDAATNVETASARLNGSVAASGDENPTRYFQYGKTGSYELGSINKGVAGAGAYYHDLSGLDPVTLYYFRAYATNGAGTGYGSQRSFTTLPPPGWSGKVGGTIDPGKVGGIDVAQIEKIGGVS